MEPYRPEFVDNPPWATKIIAASYQTLGEILPNAKWLPRLEGVKYGPGSTVIGHAKRYGCGAYGCVFPTLDPKVVLKITTDDTEAEFAALYADKLVGDICVRYYVVSKLDVVHRGNQVYILWRDSADRVGRIHDAAENPRRALVLLDKQHQAAQAAFSASLKREHGDVNKLVARWLKTCEAMATAKEATVLNPLGAGLIENYERHHLLFGDLHGGNFGQITRDSMPIWVITDPGHIAVIS